MKDKNKKSKTPTIKERDEAITWLLRSIEELITGDYEKAIRFNKWAMQEIKESD